SVMGLQIECERLGLSVGMQVSARDAVAVDACARLATSGRLRACSFALTALHTRRASNLTRFGRPRLGTTSFLTGSRSPKRLQSVVPWSGFSHFALALDEIDVAVHGEVAEAFHAPARLRPPHLDPVHPVALPYAHDYAGVVRRQVTSSSRFEQGPLQVPRLPANQCTNGIGIGSLRHQPRAKPMI